MASIRLTKVIEKMKLENLTPEIDITNVKISQPDINRPALQASVGYRILPLLMARAVDDGHFLRNVYSL